MAAKPFAGASCFGYSVSSIIDARMEDVLMHIESCAPDSDAREGEKPASGRHAKACCAAGFSALLAWLCLYWGGLVLDDVEMYNHALFAVIAHAVALVAIAALGRMHADRPKEEPADGDVVPHRDGFAENLAVAAAGIGAAVLLAVYFFVGGALAAGVVSVAFGLASASLGVVWVRRISGERVRFSFTCALVGMVAAVLVSLACMNVGAWLEMLLCIVLPAFSGAMAFGPAPEAPNRNALVGDDVPHKKLPWPFISALLACCMVCAFFVGLATNPYVLQSQTIVRWWLVLACAALLVLLSWSRIAKRSDMRAFFLASLAFLFVGLFLFSGGVLGSIILPLGMVMAAETCCVAQCWATVCLIARRAPDSALPVACFGLLFGDGMLARGSGMFVNNSFTLSFPVVAMVASALIAAFALFYAFATSVAQRDGAVVPVGLDESDDRAGSFLDSFGFTTQEQRVAACIIEGMKYREIAERLDLTERTVKFHAKNAFEKAGVTKRADFEQRAHDWK